jgi:Tol biopolymer transport system component
MLQSIAGDRFERAVIAVIVILLAAIGVVIVHGDQLGLVVQRYTPIDQGSSRTAITVTLDEPIVPGSLPGHFSINPAIPGKLSVSQNQIQFKPAQMLQLGQTYSVTFNAGIRASSGRTLKQDLSWQFHVRPPNVVYLGPADNNLRNLYTLDPETSTTQQITASIQGVLDFGVAPDGSAIAYSELQPEGNSNLMLWEASTGKSRLLYACPHQSCNSPTWRPDSAALAFELIDLNAIGTGPSASRVWILDITSGTANPLFRDNQQLGYMPRWSPDGSRLAVFDANTGGIVIHDFKTEKDHLIRSTEGELGQFSPDGNWLYYPRVVDIDASHSVIHLVLVDLSSNLFVQHDLIPDSDQSDETEAIWLSDSKGLIVARRLDASGNSGPQLYKIDISTGETTPLITDLAYAQSNLQLSPLGDVLLMQRFAFDQSGARPALWSYNLTTHELKRVVENAGIAGWLP